MMFTVEIDEERIPKMTDAARDRLREIIERELALQAAAITRRVEKDLARARR